MTDSVSSQYHLSVWGLGCASIFIIPLFFFFFKHFPLTISAAVVFCLELLWEGNSTYCCFYIRTTLLSSQSLPGQQNLEGSKHDGTYKCDWKIIPAGLHIASVSIVSRILCCQICFSFYYCKKTTMVHPWKLVEEVPTTYLYLHEI